MLEHICLILLLVPLRPFLPATVLCLLSVPADLLTGPVVLCMGSICLRVVLAPQVDSVLRGLAFLSETTIAHFRFIL